MNNKSLIPQIFLFLSLSFATITCYGQIDAEFVHKETTLGVHEEYYVLPGKGKIRHGSYVKYSVDIITFKLNATPADLIRLHEVGNYGNGLKTGVWKYYFPKGYRNELMEEGSYAKGLKHGLWKTYWKDTTNTELMISEIPDSDSTIISLNDNNTIPQSIGVYFNDFKLGNWSYFSYRGDLVQKYNHRDRVLILNSEFEDSTQYLNHPAIYIGGNDHLFATLRDGIKRYFQNYPSTGYIRFGVVIDSNGEVEKVKILEKTSLGSDLQRFITSALKDTSGNWVPFLENGIPSDSEFKFQLIVIVKKTGNGTFELGLTFSEIM
jgi:antitoxin component YwqK of YwqJK toxin-antitoxin module